MFRHSMNLVDEYRAAVAGDAARTVFEQAPVDGHPILIEIDRGSGIDDESCYTITGYDVGP